MIYCVFSKCILLKNRGLFQVPYIPFFCWITFATIDVIYESNGIHRLGSTTKRFRDGKVELTPPIVPKYAGVEQFFNAFKMLMMLILVQSVGVIIIRILRTNVCKTNLTSLVFHFQLPQLGRTQLWGFPHFPTFAFYSHNAVFSHTSFKWFPGRRKFLFQPFCLQFRFHYSPICTELMVYLYLYLFDEILI